MCCSAYNHIRLCCSAKVNALLIVNSEFMARPKNDPLTLYRIIKRQISARPNGNAELNRLKALGEWYTLKLESGERMVDFGSHRISKSGTTMRCSKTRDYAVDVKNDRPVQNLKVAYAYFFS